MLGIVRESLPDTSRCLRTVCVPRYHLTPAFGLASYVSVLKELILPGGV